MKNFTPFLVFMALFVAVTGYGQRSSLERFEEGQKISESMMEASNDIAYYHVVEKINMNFGSRVTSYNVPTLSMVSKSEMGPNNSRTITPRYGKAKPKPVEAIAVNTNAASIVTVKPEIAAPRVMIPIASKIEKTAIDKEDMIVKIDLLRTYERVLDKGYKSVEMLKKVANGRFFDGDLLIALKHYNTLFEMTDNLEPIYFYRYAQCLKADGQNAKSAKMMEIFKERDK